MAPRAPSMRRKGRLRGLGERLNVERDATPLARWAMEAMGAGCDGGCALVMCERCQLYKGGLGRQPSDGSCRIDHWRCESQARGAVMTIDWAGGA